MLKKVQAGAIVALVIMALRTFLPDIDIPEGLQDAVMLLIVFVAQFFKRETVESVRGLSLK